MTNRPSDGKMMQLGKITQTEFQEHQTAGAKIYLLKMQEFTL